MTTPTDDVVDEVTRTRSVRFAYAEMLVSALLGLLAAFVLSIEAWRLAANPATTFSCDINSFISCGKVARAWQSTLFGFPNSFIGLVCEAVVITLAVAGLLGVRFPRRYLLAAQFVYGLGFVFAWWLFVQSYTVIGALCPWCLLITVTTTTVFTSMMRVNILEGHIKIPGPARPAVERALRLGVDHVVVVLVFTALAALIIAKYF